MTAPLFRPYRSTDRDAVLAVCVAAFEPIHAGFRRELGPELFDLWYSDWQADYAAIFDGHDPGDTSNRLHVMTVDDEIVAFVFASVDAKRRGEIGLNAVAPAWQGRGFGKVLYDHALADMKLRGAVAATVGTGGDEAHGAARAAYRSAGFERTIPSVYLFKLL